MERSGTTLTPLPRGQTIWPAALSGLDDDLSDITARLRLFRGTASSAAGSVDTHNIPTRANRQVLELRKQESVTEFNSCEGLFSEQSQLWTRLPPPFP